METEWNQNGIKMESGCVQLNCVQSNYGEEARIYEVSFAGISAQVPKTLIGNDARACGLVIY